MRLFANWSYVEGIRAEELSRANWLAERAALRAEALGAVAFALLGRAPEPTVMIWKSILTSQHHDVHCFCGPGLKRKAIGWLRAAEQQADQLSRRAVEALLPRIRRLPFGEAPIVVFNTTPHPVMAPVSIEASPAEGVVTDAEGQAVPCETETIGRERVRLTFIARSAGLGYAAYALAPGTPFASETALDSPLEFENSFYQVRLELDGTFAMLRPLPARRDVLASGLLRGNQLAGCNSQGLGTRHTGSDDVSRSRVQLQPSARGPELAWQPDAARCRQTPLGVTLTVSGNFGPQARATAVIRMYQDLPWIEVQWTLDFDEASIGSFFDDETKLRMQWPLGFAGPIVHDIAFGHTTSLPERPFFPVSWVDICDGTIGLAYFHQGTPKHWVKDGVLNNLLAWGEDTDAIGNRLEMGRWPKTFDQRLRGSHTFRAAVYPHAGDWRAADVAGMARSFGQRPVAFWQRAVAGDLPARLEVLALTGAGLAGTAVWAEAGQVICRCYSTGQPAQGEARLQGLRPAGLYALSGAAVEQLGPFEIGHLRFAPNHLSGER
jgi:hypothetical protein